MGEGEVRFRPGCKAEAWPLVWAIGVASGLAPGVCQEGPPDPMAAALDGLFSQPTERVHCHQGSSRQWLLVRDRAGRFSDTRSDLRKRWRRALHFRWVNRVVQRACNSGAGTGMLFSERNRQKELAEAEAAGESFWTSSCDARARTRIWQSFALSFNNIQGAGAW